MSDSFLPYQNPTTTDKKLDSESLTVGANTVERERVQIAGSTATLIAPVSATNGLSVDPKTLPPGASTSANQDLSNGYLSDILSRQTSIVNAVKLDDLPPSGTPSSFLIGGLADDTAPDSVDEGDAGVLRISLNRNLYIQVRDAAGNERGANVNASNQLTTAEANSSTIATNTGNATTALQIIDDWDESDRAKVNPIVGVAGVAAGAGAVGTTTQRVTLASDDPGVTSLQLMDDAIVADDAGFIPATTKVIMAGFEFDDTTPDSVNEGDAGAARMSGNRNIYTQIRDAAGNERGVNVDASNQLLTAEANSSTIATNTGNATTALQIIDDWDESDRAKVNPIVGVAGVAAGAGAVGTTTQRVTLASDDPAVTSLQTLDNAISGSEMQVDVVAALPAGDNNIGNVDIVSVPAPLSTTGGGTEATALRVTIATDSTGVLSVDDNGSSLTVDGGVTAVGTIADDSPTPGAPVMVGGTAKSPDGTDPGNVSAEDDVTRAITDLNRRLYVNTTHPQMWSYHENSSSALTDATVAADPGDGYSIFVTDIVFSTGAATACNIFFEEGASVVLGPYYLEAVAGRGLVIHFGTPKKITASTALTVTTSAAIAHGLDVCGYVAKV